MCFFFRLLVESVIHPLFLLLPPGEFIVGIVNAIAAWLAHLPNSMSEFNLHIPPVATYCARRRRTSKLNSLQRGFYMDSQLHMPSVRIRLHVIFYDYLTTCRSAQ